VPVLEFVTVILTRLPSGQRVIEDSKQKFQMTALILQL